MRIVAFLILFLISQGAMAASRIQSCESGGSCGTRGGGDFLEWSFYDMAKAVVPRLATSANVIVQSDAAKMTEVLQCLKIEISEEGNLQLDGRSVMAINIPAECKIILSRPSWEKLISDHDRVRLVLHELLALALIKDFQYKRSQALTNEYFRVIQKPIVFAVNKWKIFAESSIFLVPADVALVRVTVVGAGGGGGGGHLNRGAGGGGGAGGAVKTKTLIVSPSSHILVTVGKGGAGGLQGGINGQDGESTSFGKDVLAPGGGGGFSGYYNSTEAEGGSGGGSGGGGGGNGTYGVCSGRGGSAGARGENGWVSRNGGKGGAGTSWDSLKEHISLIDYNPGEGGRCTGPTNTYNGGGGGGGLLLNSMIIQAESGTASEGMYGGHGGSGGFGYGAGGGGGSGADGKGGDGADGVVYIEYFSMKNEFISP